ncbi:hypothetical protein DPEC_G00353440 [Dallia pectoralis]|uniref:Uncharacterized protein n=1 Tax=Dallia pectoralis TaxID=75939 RepID=A0ACC2F2P7_DALPE|nr:hypothetical protein DPEC_G00353440 [Dallia pectoralis]
MAVELLRKKKEEETLYAVVKDEGSSPTQQSPAIGVNNWSEEKAKGSSTTQQSPATGIIPTDDRPASHSQPCRVVAVCLGVLCVFLVSGIVGVCVFSTGLSEHNEYLLNFNSGLSAAVHILQSNITNISAANRELSQERDRLEWNLNIIYQLKDIPVNKYCSKTNSVTICNPCEIGWKFFQSSCYQILYPNAPWKTWDQSNELCKNNNSSLVVINSEDEQGFISKQLTNYYDQSHGYWIGLTYQPNNQSWMWVDGSPNNGSWSKAIQGNNKCVLNIPPNNSLPGWNAADCSMQNRWVCETTALKWSN